MSSSRLKVKISRYEPNGAGDSMFTNDDNGFGRVTLHNVLERNCDLVIQFGKFGRNMICEAFKLGGIRKFTTVRLTLVMLPSGQLLVEVENTNSAPIVSCTLDDTMIYTCNNVGRLSTHFVLFKSGVNLRGVQELIRQVGV